MLRAVTEKCEIRICDFGLSREINQVLPRSRSESAADEAAGGVAGGAPPLQSVLTKHVVTRWYRAPELILLAQQVRSPKFTVGFSQSSYILMTHRVVGAALPTPRWPSAVTLEMRLPMTVARATLSALSVNTCGL